MKYLVIDAEIGGTGVRSKYESVYIEPEDLKISSETVSRLRTWLVKYQNEFYKGYVNDSIIEELDREGIQISWIIKEELSEVKIEYLSDAKMTRII